MAFLFLLICCHLVAAIYSQPFRVAVGSTRTGDRGNHFFIQCQHLGNNSIVTQAEFYRNGVNFIEDNGCMKDHATVFTNGSAMIRLIPSCEGHIQCGAIKILSEPIEICAYPELLPGISNNQISVTSIEGENVTLPCPLSVSSLNGFNVDWFRNFNGQHSRIFNGEINEYDYSITINQATSGTYYCRATTTKLNDGHFSVLSGPQIDLLVQRRHVSPQFLTNMTYSQEFNGNHIIRISIHGTPPLRFFWYLNSTRLNTSLEFIQGQDRYTANVSSKMILNNLPTINGPTKLTVTILNMDTSASLHSISQTGLLLPNMVINPTTIVPMVTTTPVMTVTMSPTMTCTNRVNSFDDWIESVDKEVLKLLSQIGAIIVLGAICGIQLLIIVCLSITVCCLKRKKKRQQCKKSIDNGGDYTDGGQLKGKDDGPLSPPSSNISSPTNPDEPLLMVAISDANDTTCTPPADDVPTHDTTHPPAEDLPDNDDANCLTSNPSPPSNDAIVPHADDAVVRCNSIAEILIDVGKSYYGKKLTDRTLSSVFERILIDIIHDKILSREVIMNEFVRVGQLIFGLRIPNSFFRQISSISNGGRGSIDEILNSTPTNMTPTRTPNVGFTRALSSTEVVARFPMHSSTEPIPQMENNVITIDLTTDDTNGRSNLQAQRNPNSSGNNNANGNNNSSYTIGKPISFKDCERKTVRQDSCEDYKRALQESPLILDDGSDTITIN